MELLRIRKIKGAASPSLQYSFPHHDGRAAASSFSTRSVRRHRNFWTVAGEFLDPHRLCPDPAHRQQDWLGPNHLLIGSTFAICSENDPELSREMVETLRIATGLGDITQLPAPQLSLL